MKPTRWAVLIMLALVAGCWAIWSTAYARGRADESLAPYRLRRDTLLREIRHLDTVYRADTVRLWRLVREVDTVVHIDSIPVIASDSARADTAIRLLRTSVTVCVSALSTCEQRVAAEQRLRRLADSLLAVEVGRRRSPVRAGVAGALAGAATVLLLRR